MLFAACKKADFAQKSSLQNEERFFKLPANARPELKRIVEDLKIKNKIHPFINEFIASEGYPLWEFAQFKKRKFNVTNRGDGNEQDSLVQVPIVQEEAQYVKDILNIRIDSSILYKLIAGEEYASFGFNKNPNRTTPNANDIVGTIMAYEHLIWGQNIFEITDNRLFDNWPQGAPKPDSFYVVQKFTTTYSTITWVCGFHTGGQLQSCPPGVEHCFELIPEICSITWVSTTYEGDGDSGEWVPIPPTITPGSGSGGGTGSNPTTPNPPNNLPTICGSGRGWVRIVPDIETGIWKNPCTGIPVPIDNLEDLLWFDEHVKDSTNNPCVGAVITTLSSLGDKLPALIRNFFSSSPTFSMTIRIITNSTWGNPGIAPEGAHTPENISSNNFNIFLNNYYANITDLGTAATIIHEAFHCQLMNWYREALINNNQALRVQLASDFGYLFPPDFNADSSLNYIINSGNPTQHQDIITRYQNIISNALYQFALVKGISVSLDYCKDLSWAGTFDSKAFKDLANIDKERILERVNAEKDPYAQLTDPSGMYTVNSNNVNPKGHLCN